MEMEVESNLSHTHNNFGQNTHMNDALFYDFLTNDMNFPILAYGTVREDLNVINNNSSNTNESKNNENSSKNCNIMPPPANIGRNKKKESMKPKENCYRPISPREYDSDDSSNSSRGTPPQSLHGIIYSNVRNNLQIANQQNFKRPQQFFPSNHYIQANNFQFTACNQNTYNNRNSRYHSNSPHANSHVTTSGQCGQNVNNMRVPRRYHNHQNHPVQDVMIRRAHGLVERFKSRGRLLRIDSDPRGLLTGGQFDRLSQAIWDVFINKVQKEKTYEDKIALWKKIFLYLNKCLQSYGLFMVGSTMSGFGLETSDIDMCLLTKPSIGDPRIDALQHLNHIRVSLEKSEMVSEIDLILAKVPILKFRDKETKFEVDLNFNNSVGIRNTRLLHSYAKIDWRTRPLVIAVKLWAQANGINDAKNLTVSSYSWTLMVLHYLQCGVTPPVLPCLHTLAPEFFNRESDGQSMDVQEDIAMKFCSLNSQTLGELLIGFFHYYSVFEYSRYAVSVRTGCRLPIEDCRNMKAPKNEPHQWKFLCIEEPFDFTNTARSVYDIDAFKHIKNVILASYHELAVNKMLNNVLPLVTGGNNINVDVR